MVAEDVERDDTLTLAAVGIVAYVCCDMLHELAGHGGVCLATGGRIASLSSVHVQCFGGWQRLVCAAGILANLAAGVIGWLTLRGTHRASARYFLWLFVAYNWFTGFGYLVTSSLANAGDVANAFHGVNWHWRPGTIALGVAGYALAVWALSRVKPAPSWRTVLIPYFAAAGVACAAGALNSVLGPLSALTSAVNTTLGSWGFLLLPPLKTMPASPVAPLLSSRGWITAAALLTLVFVFCLGPGRLFR